MFRAFVLVVITHAALAQAPRVASAASAPEPTGAHPRILLDDELRTAWKAAAKVKDSAVAKAIARCEDTRKNPKEYERDSYMGFDWSANLNACLIAWVVRGSDDDAKSAIVFFKALLDDQEHLGDGKGGEKTVRRDTGYAIRSVPPYAAIAYDWLHDHPAMTPELRAHAVERFTQWLSWYKKDGYHNRSPGTNYHAGYVLAATMVAVALGGEGGSFNTELWNHLRDDVWGKDMAKALGPRGLLDGGDFPEGWQYAPLTVAEYALSYRVVAKHGITVDGVDRWLAAMLVRTIHARSGARDTLAAIGDADIKQPSIEPNVMTLLAILIGPAPEIAQRQAAGELQRLGLRAKEYPLYEAIAQARSIQPAAPVLDKWPTSYFAPGVSTFYARTSWNKDGVWLASICAPQYDADHLPPAAGNVMLTRGVDEVLIDPSPYGSLSTLTSNAPTVDSKQQVPKYRPSQAVWGETTHFDWALQTASGVIAARCDYADQYKFQDRATDIALALRDFVVIPWGKARADASMVVVDRAETGAADQAMYLRFRSPANFAMQGDVAVTKVGATTFSVRRISPATARGEVRAAPVGACWDMDRGKCDMARIPTGEYRITIPGPKPEAIHVLDAAAANDLRVASAGDGVVELERGGERAYVATRATSYTSKPASTHVVLIDGTATPTLTVTKAGDACKVDVTAGGAPRQPAPLVFTVDASCKATEDVRVGPGAPDLTGAAAGSLIPVGGTPPRRKARNGFGCCDAGSSGATGSAILALGLAASLRRRRRR
ncbi:MAG TPA: hypothetical protein VFQ53_03470 [Kofleriaceae bacterium]|nr:hypothetical protein [Kofleriaceae bacterium]